MNQRFTEELDIGLAGMPHAEFAEVQKAYLRVRDGIIMSSDYCVDWPSLGGRPRVIRIPEEHVGRPVASLIRVLIPRP